MQLVKALTISYAAPTDAPSTIDLSTPPIVLNAHCPGTTIGAGHNRWPDMELREQGLGVFQNARLYMYIVP